MALTLNDIRQQLATNGAAVQFRMVDRFLAGSESKILPRLHFIENKSLLYTYLVAGGATVSSRSLNENYGSQQDTPDSRAQEPMSIVGGEVKTDYVMIDLRGDAARLTQLDKKMKAAGKNFDKLFFNGNPANPVNGPKARGNELRGLKVRAAGTQLLAAGVNGGQLNLDLVDEAIDAVAGDNAAKVIQCNRPTRRLLSKLMREQSRVTITMDDKRQVLTYDDCQFDVIDEDENHQPILDFNEQMGTAPDCTSVYVTRFGKDDDEDFVQGIIGNQWMQLRPPANFGTHVLEVAESLIGLGTFHERSFARIAGVKKAA